MREMIGGFEYWVREGLPIEGAVGGDRLGGSVGDSRPVLQACLNGSRPRRSTTRSRCAPTSRPGRAPGDRRGRDELHIHPRDGDGADTLDPEPVSRVVVMVRAACPDTPLGLTTGLWGAGGDPARRLALVAGWWERPTTSP